MAEQFLKKTRTTKGKQHIYQVYLLNQRARKQHYSSIWIVLAFVVVIIITIVLADFLTSTKQKDKIAKASHRPLTFTECGLIQGQVMSVEGKDIFVFKGIPYALAPIGKLRWKPPVPVKLVKPCWTGIYQADKFGSPCMQQSMKNGQVIGNEDCLFLNIWTDSLNASEKLPVVIWIHEGALVSGNGNMEGPHVAKTFLKQQRLVIVSFNYRLSVFGFLALKILAEFSTSQSSGNYGLLDQIEAIKWTKRNIHYFGGDPNSITVAGAGAGGTSVLALLVSPLSMRLFDRAISMRGQAIKKRSHSEAYMTNVKIISRIGCTNMDMRDTLFCLYHKPAKEILLANPWNLTKYIHIENSQNTFMKSSSCTELFVTDVTPFFSSFKEFKDFVTYTKVSTPLIAGTYTQSFHKVKRNNVQKESKVSPVGYFVLPSVRKYSTVQPDASGFPINASNSSCFHYLQDVASNKLSFCPLQNFLEALAAYNYTVYQYLVPDTFPFTKEFADKDSITSFLQGWNAVHIFETKDLVKAPQSVKEIITAFQRELTTFIKLGRPRTTSWLPYPLSVWYYNINGTIIKNNTSKYENCEVPKA